jgi:uncharacterized protein
MLKVDLGLLDRRGRLAIDDRIGPDDPVWKDAAVRPGEPLEIRLTVQKVSGDILVRGQFAGEAHGECRRCLRDVRLWIEEPLTLLYRPGITAAEAEAEEIYACDDRDRELDLAPAVREHVTLALAQYPLCSEACKGLCPKCGTDWNERSCSCEKEQMDERWAALRRPAD